MGRVVGSRGLGFAQSAHQGHFFADAVDVIGMFLSVFIQVAIVTIKDTRQAHQGAVRFMADVRIVIVGFEATDTLKFHGLEGRRYLLCYFPAFERLEAVRHGTGTTLFLVKPHTGSAEDLFTGVFFTNYGIGGNPFADPALHVVFDFRGTCFRGDGIQLFGVNCVVDLLIYYLECLRFDL